MRQPMIEIHNWKEGAPRPGLAQKHDRTCLEILEIPPSGAMPVAGDILLLPDFFEERSGLPVPYRVMEREFIYSDRDKEGDSQVPLRFLSVMIHVRRAHDYDDPNAQPAFSHA